MVVRCREVTIGLRVRRPPVRVTMQLVAAAAEAMDFLWRSDGSCVEELKARELGDVDCLALFESVLYIVTTAWAVAPAGVGLAHGR